MRHAPLVERPKDPGHRLLAWLEAPCGDAAAARVAPDAASAPAKAWAADVAPFIRQAQAAGATTLQAVADAMKARSIPAPGGRGGWYPATVARVLKAAA